MCYAMTGPFGRPMTDSTFASLPEEEQRFWEEFDVKAREEMAAAGVTVNFGDRKLKSSPELQAMYNRVVTEFKGGDYCHVGQLREIFDFEEPSAAPATNPS